MKEEPLDESDAFMEVTYFLSIIIIIIRGGGSLGSIVGG